MPAQRLGLHLARQTRSPALRSTLHRRFASDKTELRGAADNAFNRERAAAKAHAAATSGLCCPLATHQKYSTDPRNSYRSLAQTHHLVHLPIPPNPHSHTKPECSVTTPCLILAGINAWNLWDEHWEHWEHMPPLEERIEYPYQNVRTKNYPWGDGDKTLLYVFPLKVRCWVGC